MDVHGVMQLLFLVSVNIIIRLRLCQSLFMIVVDLTTPSHLCNQVLSSIIFQNKKNDCKLKKNILEKVGSITRINMKLLIVSMNIQPKRHAMPTVHVLGAKVKRWQVIANQFEMLNPFLQKCSDVKKCKK